MNRIFAILFIIAFSLLFSGEARSADEPKEEFMKEFHNKQKELYEKRKYLGDREERTASELNESIASYEKKPNTEIVQKIEDLKSLLINNLQQQIINDRNYIDYMEKELFTVWETKEKTEKTAEELKREADELKEITDEYAKNASQEPSNIKFEEYVDQVKQNAEKLMKDVESARFQGE